MGGGGSYYDRDIKDGYKTTSQGYSKVAEEQLSKSRVDVGLLPKGRTVVSNAESPVIYGFDVTGSMGTLPKVIYDKMPLIAGQIVENGYLEDPEISLAAIGDVKGDSAPIQVGDFSKIKKLDDWLQRVWLEGGGGGNGGESYEFTMYFYARYCEIPNAVTPFFLITGDEHFRETLYKSDLERHFGGKHETIQTQAIFEELKKKFKGNVFLIHPSRSNGVSNIVRQWQELLGKERVVLFDREKAVADVTLGLFAIMTGSRTLDEYCDDMKTKRDKAQDDDRIAEVRESLKQLVSIAPKKRAVGSAKRQTPTLDQGTDAGGGKKPSGGKKKPGRL